MNSILLKQILKKAKSAIIIEMAKNILVYDCGNVLEMYTVG